MSTTHRANARAIHSGGGAVMEHLHCDRSGAGPGVMGASTLEGKPVVDAMGQDFGHIEKIMLDVQRGRIAYAVLSVTAGFGVRHKLMAVPWGALILDPKRKRFVLDLPEERAGNGLGRDEDHCSEPDRPNEMGRYYGA